MCTNFQGYLEEAFKSPDAGRMKDLLYEAQINLRDIVALIGKIRKEELKHA